MISKLRQRGALLMAAVVLVVIIAALVTAMSFLSVSNIGASGSHMSSAQTFFVASSGLERALFQFSKLGTLCASLTNTNLAVGSGTFSTTGTVYPLAATTSTLSGSGIAVTTPTIFGITVTVGAYTNYAPHGRLRIENEELDYSTVSNSAAVCGAVTPPCFVAYRRGANSTTAATHAAAINVYQDNQCLIRSTGTTGASQRIQEATVK